MATGDSQTIVPKPAGKSIYLCGADQLNAELLAADPGYRARRQAVESFNRLASTAPPTRTGQANIAVVVHVVYKKPEHKIQQAQIDAQIRVLNEDYNIKNTDISVLPDAFKPLIGNPNIRFFLATRDPQGAPTTGVVYKETTADGFPTGNGPLNRKMKSGPLGSKGWRSDRYLNIWVCDMKKDPLGYASFPGEASLTEDGVVIDFTCFGVGGTAAPPFHLGRTVTHEVGHWLNLRHIWGDDYDERDDPNDPRVVQARCSGSDLVDDTPNQSGPNFGEKVFPRISCNNGPNGDLFYNYMDYGNDKILVMFTKGQVDRINATLAGPRSTVLGADFSNRRIAAKTTLAPVEDESVHFLVHGWDKPGENDIAAINKTNLTLQVLSAESNYQTDLFENRAIGFKADASNPGADLLFAFGNWTGGKRADLFVLQSSHAATNLSVLSADSTYQKSVLDTKIKLRLAGPIYSFAVAPWSKESSKPDLIVIQKPTIRADSYSVLITVLSGASDFSKITHTFTTPALDNTDSSLDLQLADWNGDGSLDFVVIKKSNTSKHLTEVTVLSGFSDFQDVIFKTTTSLGGTERNFTFLCTDWTGDGSIDLVGIKKWDTFTGKVEVHVLAG